MNKIKKYIIRPKCHYCGAPMKNSIDSKTGKESPYLWEPTCDHNKNLRLSVG